MLDLAISSLSPDWARVLKSEFEQPYFLKLKEFLSAEYESGKNVFPEKNNVFAALSTTSLRDTKIIILGQDPYHGEGQAHGLSFSVQPGIKPPPSLMNIFKELITDCGITMPSTGYLLPWAEQGVLLLNRILTVCEAQPGSHQQKGWEKFTDAVVRALVADTSPKVFMLWGSHAQKISSLIQNKDNDSSPHLILMAPHPSPLSSYRGFFGCRHFSKANDFLIANNRKPIAWELT